MRFSEPRWFRRAIRSMWRTALSAILFLTAVDARQVDAQEGPSAVPPERAWLTIAASSVDDISSSVASLLTTTDRPELADVWRERFGAGWRDFAGIDRTQALGWLHYWPQREASATEIVVLPVTNREELLRTVTNELVRYQFRSESLAEIERPEIPYFVWFDAKYAWMGDDVAHLQRAARDLRSLLRMLTPHHTAAVSVDLTAIPAPDREAWWRGADNGLAALMQQQDDEPDAPFRERRAAAGRLRPLLEQVHQSLVEATVRLDLPPHHERLALSLSLNATPGSELATTFARWRAYRSPLAFLSDSPTATCSGFISLPGSTGSDIPGPGATAYHLGWQIFGTGPDDRVVVLGVSGAAIGWFESPSQGDDAETGAGGPERLLLGDAHVWWRRLLHVPYSAVRVREPDRLWLAFGDEEAATIALHTARVSANEAREDAPRGALGLRLDPALFARQRTRGQQISPLNPRTSGQWIEVRIAERAAAGELQFEVAVPSNALPRVGEWLSRELSDDLRRRFDEVTAPPTDAAD